MQRCKDCHKLGKDNEEYSAEYKTTRQALGGLSPFNYKNQLKEIKSMTPEEYETVLLCLHETQTNMKLYAMGFTAVTLGFSYWQREFIPRWFYSLAFTTGMMLGAVYGFARSGWFIVEQLDALGKDYELSRIMKQGIFDSRPDIDSAQRAQYYIHQENQNAKATAYERQLKRQ